MKSNIGEVISALHRESGITQKEIADKFGISKQAYDSYLTHEVRSDIFLKIVDALGYHVEIRPGRTGMVEIKRINCEDCVQRQRIEGVDLNPSEDEVDFYDSTGGDKIDVRHIG